MNTKQVIYIFLMVPFLSFGWGRGHHTLGLILAKRMPEPWCSRLQGEALETFCSDNHYPDSFLKIEADKRVTQEELAFLASHNMKTRYDFHSDKGRGVAFALLTRALRDNRPENVCLWFAVLAHSTADMVACNHDPLVHVVTYGWSAPTWDMRFSNGLALAKIQPCLDLGWVETLPEANAIWEKRIAQILTKDSTKNVDDAVLDVMMAGPQGVGTCSAYGKPIAAAATGWIATKEPAYRDALAKNLSELGAWAVERLLRDFVVAQRLAKAQTMPNVSDPVIKQYQLLFDDFVATRDYEEDSFVKGLTTPPKPESPFLAVIAEPTWRMNEGLFGFNDRVLAAQTVTALCKQGKNAALMDVRKVMANGIPIARIPAVLIFAQKVSAYHSLNPNLLIDQLLTYRAAGGKVIWIGGALPDYKLCAFPKDLVVRLDIAKGYSYAWARLPVSTNTYETLTLKVEGHAARKLSRFPNFSAGWHAPSNNTYFKPEIVEYLHPLAYLNDRESTLLIGGAWPKTNPTFAYLPVYTVFPYLWTKEIPTLTPFTLDLDAQGVESLTATLTLLQVDRLF